MNFQTNLPHSENIPNLWGQNKQINKFKMQTASLCLLNTI